MGVMTWLRAGAVVAAALSAAAPASLAAGANGPPAPFLRDASTIVIAQPAMTETQALAALARRGLRAITSLGQVGDYWECEGLLNGKPVVAYLLDDGSVSIRHAPAGQLIEAFGTLPDGVTPPVASRQNLAQMP